MRQRLFILLSLIGLVVLLIGLNAASYTPAEKQADTEILPHRSTYNTGSTGLQAYYTLLEETGHKVTRWQTAPGALLTAGEHAPGVFVAAGSFRREFTAQEAADLLRWVSEGGVLVLIDRNPPTELLTTTTSWEIKAAETMDPAIMDADPADPSSMTKGTVALRPVQPTLLTSDINAVQPSSFAGSLEIQRVENFEYEEPAGQPDLSVDTVGAAAPSESAPLVHLASGDRPLLVDTPFGIGRIVILTDPYIVANGGISLADNTMLAINLATAGPGPIAFDEYHQGYGADRNRFLQFFAGTPVVAMFLQALLLIGLAFASRSRRFARPVPESEPDRLSKLEYVSAMAELQRRTKAFDLAIENIYGEFRRRSARSLGLDNSTVTGSQLAAKIAEHMDLSRYDIEATLTQCEEIIRGEPVSRSETLMLTTKIRELESALGLSRDSRSRAV